MLRNLKKTNFKDCSKYWLSFISLHNCDLVTKLGNMKMLKKIALIFVSLILVSCDNAKPNSSQNDNSIIEPSSPDNYLDEAQDAVINPIRKKLPITVDQITTLTGIYKNDNVINYQYDVKKLTKYALLLPTTQDTIRNNLLATYCKDTEDIRQLKTLFPNGANYHYFINNQEIIIIEIEPSDCAPNQT